MIRTAVHVIAVVLLAVLALSAVLIARQIKVSRFIKGEFQRSIDITDRVVSKVAVWLKDVEGAEIDPDRIRSRAGSITVTSHLVFEYSGLKKGSFSEQMDEASYDESTDRAFELAGVFLKELITDRLKAAGYAENISDKEADALIYEALGMSLEDYIRKSGTDFMPDRDELKEEINRSGEYGLPGSMIEWTRNGSVVKEKIGISNDILVILETGDIYRKQQDNEEKQAEQ